MTLWVVAGVLCALGLVGTLVALFAGGRVQRRGPVPPDWTLPAPLEVRRTRFPLAWQGYEPTAVDLHLDALASAYEELYLAADEDTRERARARLTLRRGS